MKIELLSGPNQTLIDLTLLETLRGFNFLPNKAPNAQSDSFRVCFKLTYDS